MNHTEHEFKNNNANLGTSITSIIFSIIASSHHWLHSAIIFILGSSSMTGVIWLRRFMIVITLLSTFYTMYRQYKQTMRPTWLKVINLLSVLISIGFISYTLITFGW